jgi:hypothetical protein
MPIKKYTHLSPEERREIKKAYQKQYQKQYYELHKAEMLSKSLNRYQLVDESVKKVSGRPRKPRTEIMV